jgi:inositol-pentakisphosphate 2-kinase
MDSSEQVIEFKPKWLCQSLSAPANSKRCRQCARVARVNAERSRAGERLTTLRCPLDLVSRCLEDLKIVSSQLLTPNDSPVMIERLTEWLKTNTILRQLCSYQKQLDQKGVLVGDVKDENFLVAMALRDCTVFVKFPPKDSAGKVEARLGDLDLKSEGKKEYWRSTELALIEEGWYEGKESEENRQPLTCQLSPERWARKYDGRNTAQETW